jgi:cyclopropane-fatty-acyl-phospholipid synthase
MSLAQIVEILVGGRLPLRFTAYDGSATGPADALGIDLVTPRGTTYLATAPGELGLVRAYVSGDLQLHGVHPGDPYELLKALKDDVLVDVIFLSEAFTRPKVMKSLA